MKTALLAAVLLLPLAARAQDRGATTADPNMMYPSSRNPVPQGDGSTPWGYGQSRDTQFVEEKDKVDAGTGAQPTDRQGAPTDLPAPETSKPELTPAVETVNPPAPAPAPKPAKKNGKKSREQLRKERRQGLKKAPAPPADKELPAVSEPGKDGTLIDDVPPQDVPHD